MNKEHLPLTELQLSHPRGAAAAIDVLAAGLLGLVPLTIKTAKLTLAIEAARELLLQKGAASFPSEIVCALAPIGAIAGGLTSALLAGAAAEILIHHRKHLPEMLSHSVLSQSARALKAPVLGAWQGLARTTTDAYAKLARPGSRPIEMAAPALGGE